MVAYPSFFKTLPGDPKRVSSNVQIIQKDCLGFIDDISTCSNHFCFKGWLAHSREDAADAMFAYINEDNLTTAYYILNNVIRSDVADNLRNRKLKKSGFISAVPIEKNYMLGYSFKGNYYKCNNLIIK